MLLDHVSLVLTLSRVPYLLKIVFVQEVLMTFWANMFVYKMLLKHLVWYSSPLA